MHLNRPSFHPVSGVLWDQRQIKRSLPLSPPLFLFLGWPVHPYEVNANFSYQTPPSSSSSSSNQLSGPVSPNGKCCCLASR